MFYKVAAMLGIYDSSTKWTKVLKFITNCIDGNKEDVFIFCDASDVHGHAAVVVAYKGTIKHIRFPCQNNSALAELEALQAALDLSIIFLKIGHVVHIRGDNKGIVESFKRALAGQESKAPIYKKMLTFVQSRGEILYSKNLKVRWIRSHSGYSLNECSDWLTRNETLDNINRFDYFNSMEDEAWEKTK